MAAMMNLSKQSFAPVPLSSFFETGCGMYAHRSKPESNRNLCGRARPVELRLGAAQPRCSHRNTLDLCMKHAKWVLDGKSYRSLELINQGHCPRTGLGTLAAHIRAPHSVHVTGSSGGTSAEGNFTAMGALVGRSGFVSAGRESFEFRCVVTSSLDERCNLPKSKCMDEHELGGVHSEVATVLRFPHDGYIRGSTGPAREYTFNGQLLRVAQW